MHTLIMMASVLVASCAHGQNPVVSCRMQDQYHVSPDPQPSPEPHPAGVDTRGDHAMGFSQESAGHHFVLLPDGGTIAVYAKREHDDATLVEILANL